MIELLKFLFKTHNYLPIKIEVKTNVDFSCSGNMLLNFCLLSLLKMLLTVLLMFRVMIMTHKITYTHTHSVIQFNLNKTEKKQQMKERKNYHTILLNFFFEKNNIKNNR